VTWLTWSLLAVGAAGMVVRSVTFVRVTLPANYGSNPGFGAYETMVAPWWLLLCAGLGLLTSVRVALVVFFLGVPALGVVAQLLSRAFGRRG